MVKLFSELCEIILSDWDIFSWTETFLVIFERVNILTNTIPLGSVVSEESQRRLSAKLKLQMKVTTGHRWGYKEDNMLMLLKEILTSVCVCVDVIKMLSWNGLSVYSASIIFYL